MSVMLPRSPPHPHHTRKIQSRVSHVGLDPSLVILYFLFFSARTNTDEICLSPHVLLSAIDVANNSNVSFCKSDSPGDSQSGNARRKERLQLYHHQRGAVPYVRSGKIATLVYTRLWAHTLLASIRQVLDFCPCDDNYGEGLTLGEEPKIDRVKRGKPGNGTLRFLRCGG